MDWAQRFKFAVSKYWLCLDGGGKWREQKYIAFCGYVDTVDNFERFMASWQFVLKEFGLKSLHFTEAMAWDGDWARLRREWGEQECDAKRTDALSRFVTLVNQHSTMQAVGVSADSRHVSHKARDSKRPDLMLFERAITIATNRLISGERLSIFCDWEDGFDVLCCKLLSKLRTQNVANARCIDLIAFGDDETYAELQAADMFAWLACKELERQSERSGEPPDPLWVQLMSGVPVEPPKAARIGEMFDAETFARMVETQRK